ncbi:MAG: orotidine-5'-phosphate decarboxylase [Ferruginibacter sp.]
MQRSFLIEQIKNKQSFLCVGLDTDASKIPVHLQGKPGAVLEFNKQIIDATKDLCVAYKINTAFYEAMGLKGWEAMEQTVNYIPSTHFKIADAKRGDIGNTSSQYAKAFFEVLKFDAITVAPYMGEDSIRPFLDYENKWTIVLGLTSNKGSKDFEMLQVVGQENDNVGQATNIGGKDNDNQQNIVGQATNNGRGYLYEKVLSTVSKWGNTENLMFVTGATQASELANIRKIVPDHFLLVPGVGFQGGSLQKVSEYGINNDCGLLVNASRAIIYAGQTENYLTEAREIAGQYQTEMSSLLSKYLKRSL